MEVRRIREMARDLRNDDERRIDAFRAGDEERVRRVALQRDRESRRDRVRLTVDETERVNSESRREETRERVVDRLDLSREPSDDQETRERSDARRVEQRIRYNERDSEERRVRDESRERVRMDNEAEALRGSSARQSALREERLRREDTRETGRRAMRREDSRERLRRVEDNENRRDESRTTREDRSRHNENRYERRERETMDLASTERLALTTIRVDDVDSMKTNEIRLKSASDFIGTEAVRDVSKSYTRNGFAVQNDIRGTLAVSKTVEQSLLDTLFGAAVMAVAYRLKNIQFNSKNIFGEIY